MEKLILTLEELAKKYDITLSHIPISIGFYYVDICIMRNKNINIKIDVEIFLHKKNISQKSMELPGNVRDKIVSNVDDFLSEKTENLSEKIEDISEYFDLLKQKENLVLEEYKKNILLTENQIHNLHMFFSPGRIPSGLTNEEILICIYLYHLRESQKRLYKIPPLLDFNFTINSDTEQSQTSGLRNAIYWIMNDLAKNYNDHL